MIREHQLSSVLSEFARTLVTDFPIQGILDRLVERIVDVLPITAAGVSLISPGSFPRYVAASDEAAMRFERLQAGIGQGPCTTAYETGEAVSLPDITLRDERFPGFCAAAEAAGLAAVFSFPLTHATGRLGALDLYRDTPGPLDPDDMAAAQTLADVAAAYLQNAGSRQDADEVAEKLRASVLHDALTGLPNRLLFEQRLEHAARRARRSHANAAVLFADLDGFKRINDRYGHPVGDALLIAVGARLTALLRPGDTLARISGDEFVVLCEDLQEAVDVELLATRIRDCFGTPFVLPDGDRGDVEVWVTASIGMAFAGHADDVGPELIRNADAAMYQAKRKGGDGHQVIDLRQADRRSSRRELQQGLTTAFARGELTVDYQPVVRAGDSLVTGVEALLRWTHPVRGPVPAPAMVAVAEDSSLILDIGAWILRRACEDRMAWLDLVPGRPLEVAVNVSGRQLLARGFRDTVEGVLRTTRVPPSALTLEMTEGIFLDDDTRALEVLNELRALGVRIALDDFGTGYSSLSYLRRFPVDIVKIDRGFVAEIGLEATSGAIISAVTNLAHVLGLSVTAEGVETEHQHDEVVAMGCDSAQGFLYARPLPAHELVASLGAAAGGPLLRPLRGLVPGSGG